MAFIRVMQFNVQLLPSVPGSSSPGNEAKERAARVTAAILGLPLVERPHVISFCEVFSEDGRDVLINDLQGDYPHIIDSLDDCTLEEDSGLMLVSRLPLRDLPSGVNPSFGGKCLFFSYDDADSDDRFSCKGVGLVSVDGPAGPMTIAFSHVQAFYDTEDEYRSTRAKQFANVIEQISLLEGSPSEANWRNVLFQGDLNMRGDPDAQRGEWKEQFTEASGSLTDKVWDGWRTWMKPPNAPSELDPGYTVNNLDPGASGELPEGLLMRLDYQTFGSLTNGEGLVPQHMRTRFRAQSDHWSLESDIHVRSQNCTPSDAVEWSGLQPWSSQLRVADLSIAFDGSYQWVYVDEPGTYSVWGFRDVELAVFPRNDLSVPWTPHAASPVSSVGIDQLNRDVENAKLDPTGIQIDSPEPYFVRARAFLTGPVVTGFAPVGIWRHTGETRESAIFLQPWAEPKDPVLPQGQPNGPFDECWFRVQVGQAFTNTDHTSVFQLFNSTGNDAAWVLHDEVGNELDRDEGTGTLELSHTTAGPETLYLLLKRTSVDDVDFHARWESGLTYLRSIPNLRPMGLRCLDETGPDWAGADEISLRLQVDGTQIFETYWDDADVHEMLRLEGQVPEVAFVNDLRVTAWEHDLVSGSAGVTTIPGLGPGDPLAKAIVRPFAVETGTYQWECSFSRTPY